MRHLYILLVFFVASSVIFSFFLFKKREPEGIPAIVINDKVITQSELNRLLQKKPRNMKRLEFIDSLITREILIQKALKDKLHREESFRKAIEDHYENLLINILKDRKYSSIKVNVTNREIFRAKPGKKLTDQEIERIRKKLADKKTQDVFENWIKDLKKKGDIRVIEQ